MPFHMEGMEVISLEGVEIIGRKVKDVFGFLDRHSGATCAVALGILAVSTYYEEADSEEEELFNPLSYFTRFLPAKETRAHSLKKAFEKKLKLPEKEETDDNEVLSIDPIGWVLLRAIVVGE